MAWLDYSEYYHFNPIHTLKNNTTYCILYWAVSLCRVNDCFHSQRELRNLLNNIMQKCANIWNTFWGRHILYCKWALKSTVSKMWKKEKARPISIIYMPGCLLVFHIYLLNLNAPLFSWKGAFVISNLSHLPLQPETMNAALVSAQAVRQVIIPRRNGCAFCGGLLPQAERSRMESNPRRSHCPMQCARSMTTDLPAFLKDVNPRAVELNPISRIHTYWIKWC